MDIIIEDVIPSKIENTIMTKHTFDNGVQTYMFRAAEGYVLHDKELDIVEIHPITEEELSRLPGYTTANCSVSASYDWEANPREFYVILDDKE